MKSSKMPKSATSEERKALQTLAREQLKLKLLKDIEQDILVCSLESWDYKSFLDELITLIQGLKGGPHV